MLNKNIEVLACTIKIKWLESVLKRPPILSRWVNASKFMVNFRLAINKGKEKQKHYNIFLNIFMVLDEVLAHSARETWAKVRRERDYLSLCPIL